MDALGGTEAALGVADDPAYRVSGSHGSRANKLLATFERDVGDLAGRGIDLIERAFGEGIDLYRVEIVGTARLHPRRVIRLLHPCARIGCLRRRSLIGLKRLELA
jgi:hypothetical protein